MSNVRIAGKVTIWGTPEGTLAATTSFTGSAILSTTENVVMDAGNMSTECATGILKAQGLIQGKSFSEFEQKVSLTMAFVGTALATVKTKAKPLEAGETLTFSGSGITVYDGAWLVESGSTLTLGSSPTEHGKVTATVSRQKNSAGNYVALAAVP